MLAPQNGRPTLVVKHQVRGDAQPAGNRPNLLSNWEICKTSAGPDRSFRQKKTSDISFRAQVPESPNFAPAQLPGSAANRHSPVKENRGTLPMIPKVVTFRVVRMVPLCPDSRWVPV